MTVWCCKSCFASFYRPVENVKPFNDRSCSQKEGRQVMEEFKVTEEELREWARIEEEAGCDVGAGYGHRIKPLPTYKELLTVLHFRTLQLRAIRKLCWQNDELLEISELTGQAFTMGPDEHQIIEIFNQIEEG